jgi:predicted DNA-binding protein
MATYKNVKPVTFTLPFSLIDELDMLSKELDKKKTTIIKEALEYYMDYQDIQLAKKRLENPTLVKADDFFDELGV